VPANESAIQSASELAIIVDQPQVAGAAADQQFALLLPKMSLEIRAALDTSLQKEIAALRSFIGSTLDSHSERLQGDLATLLPASRTPELDLPTVMPDRRPWGAISGWTLALVAIGGAAFMSWLWWKQGGEVAALRTDLTAAYAELETLRTKPEVVSPPPQAAEPAVLDPNSVLPAADADAVPAATGVVELVPTSETGAPVVAPAIGIIPLASSAAPVPPSAASASQPQTTQAQ